MHIDFATLYADSVPWAAIAPWAVLMPFVGFAFGQSLATAWHKREARAAYVRWMRIHF